jgi:histidine ammonia-lyase
MHCADLDMNPRAIRFDQGWLKIEDIVDIAHGSACAVLSDSPQFRRAIARGADFLDRLLSQDGMIYGVTTGFGDSCTVLVQPELVAELPRHLYTYHGCGLGEYLTPAQTRAVMATRLASLCKGFSGVSMDLLEQIARLLQCGVLPRIPSEGSVGASGDLTPLSYLAAVLCGEGEVWGDNGPVEAAEALAQAGIAALRLRPKEALAVMNGTAVMTALACLAFSRADYLTPLVTRITALASFALDGNAYRPGPAQRQASAGPLLDSLCAARDRGPRRRPAVVARIDRKRAQQRER